MFIIKSKSISLYTTEYNTFDYFNKKTMQKISRLLFLLFFISVTTISAQKSAIYTHDSKDFDKALSLYNENQYASAQLLFEKVKSAATNEELKSDCSIILPIVPFEPIKPMLMS